MTDASANRNRIVWLLPLVALAAGYGLGRHRSVEAPPNVAETTRDAAVSAPLRSATSARAASPAPASTALPAMPTANLPLAESFDALATRARAGDVAASMRLFRQTRRCQERPMLESIVQTSQIPSQPDATVPPAMRERILQRIDEQERRRDDARRKLAASELPCAGVTPAQIATLGEWLERAADSGDPGFGYCYVMAGTTDGYAPSPRFSDEWVDWMERYRAKANVYSERAFAAGYPQAAWYLYWVAAGPYAMPAFQIDQDLPRDYARAYAIALMQAELVERDPKRDAADELADWRDSAERLRANLDDAAIVRAQAWADAEAKRLIDTPPPSPACSDTEP